MTDCDEYIDFVVFARTKILINNQLNRGFPGMNITERLM